VTVTGDSSADAFNADGSGSDVAASDVSIKRTCPGVLDRRFAVGPFAGSDWSTAISIAPAATQKTAAAIAVAPSSRLRCMELFARANLFASFDFFTRANPFASIDFFTRRDRFTRVDFFTRIDILLRGEAVMPWSLEQLGCPGGAADRVPLTTGEDVGWSYTPSARRPCRRMKHPIPSSHGECCPHLGDP
jgi:hypothetical protein